MGSVSAVGVTASSGSGLFVEFVISGVESGSAWSGEITWN